MSAKRLAQFFGVLFCSVTLGAHAATYFVDYATGDDSNAGTLNTNPWKHAPGDTNATSTAAASALAAGDTVIFKGGIAYSGEVDVNWSGSSTLPITYDGNSAGTWGTGPAIFECASNYYHAIAAPHLKGARDNIVIRNFDIRHLKNNSSATQTVNFVAGSLDGPGTTNTFTSGGDASVYDIGGIFVYGGNWIVQDCSVHESEIWWYRCLATGNPVADVPCQQAGINVFTGTNIVITNCSMWAIGRDCMRVQGSNIVITGCNMGGPTNVSPDLQGWFAVGVRAAGALQNCTIRQCTLHDGWQYQGDEPLQRCHAGDWIHVYGNNNGVKDSSDPDNLVIDRCYFYNNHSFSNANGTGNIYLEQDSWNVTIRNCAIINPQHMAIWTSQGAISNVWIFNNTIVAYNFGSSSSPFTLYLGNSAQNVGVTNNIVVQYSSNSAALPMIVTTASPKSTVRSDYNVFYNPNTARYGSVRYTNADLTLSAWSAATGNDVHSVAANPALVYIPTSGASASSGDYRLASGSAAAGTGANLSTVFTSDLSGDTRSAPWDIGAYRFASLIKPPPNFRLAP